MPPPGGSAVCPALVPELLVAIATLEGRLLEIMLVVFRFTVGNEKLDDDRLELWNGGCCDSWLLEVELLGIVEVLISPPSSLEPVTWTCADVG